MQTQELLTILSSVTPEFKARLKAWSEDEELRALRSGCTAEPFAHGRAVGAAQVYRTISEALTYKPTASSEKRDIYVTPEVAVFDPQDLA